MNEKEKVIKYLELVSKVTFWVTVVGGGILLLMVLNSCSSMNDSMGGLSDMIGMSNPISSVIASTGGVFILIMALLLVIGISLSFISKALSIKLKEDWGLNGSIHRDFEDKKSITI